MALIILNNEQRAALSWFFSPDNKDGEPQPEGEPYEIIVYRNRLIINGGRLCTDGEWEAVPARS